MNRLGRFLFSSAVLLGIVLAGKSLLSPQPIFAQSFEAAPGIDTINNATSVYSQTGNPSLESTSVYSTASQLGGVGLLITGSVDPVTKQPLIKGAIPQVGNMMAQMIKHPPASGEMWLADFFQHSPLIPQAYAQGVGFKSLSPILPVWRTFRDLAYVFFVLVFVGIGFMIMFRQKLDGHTVVTITNALPNLVITLILITFSYAIAGFLIDLMYLLIYFIISVFAPLIYLKLQETFSLTQIALSNNIFNNGIYLIFRRGGATDLQGSVVGGAADAIGEITKDLFASLPLDLEKVVGFTAGVLGYVIIAVAMMFAVTKTFFELLKSYVTFIISVIFSPFLLLVGAFKGTGEITQWLRNLASTILPFPVVITMIFIAMALGGQGSANVGYNPDNPGGFQAPQITVGEGFSSAVPGLIALGILMLIPESVELSKKWLHAKSPFDEYIGKIGKNLEMGWKGGQLVPGFGPNIPGASKLIPGLATTAGTAGIGGLAGAAVGGYSQRKEGLGRMALGALGGGTVGTLVGGAAPTVAHYAPKVINKVTEVVKGGKQAIFIGEEATRLFGGGRQGGETEKKTQATLAQAQSGNPTPVDVNPTDTGD